MIGSVQQVAILRTSAAAVALAPLLAACGNTVGVNSPPVTTRTVTTTESPTTPLARIVPKVSNCGIQKPTVKPTELIITCADANERATRIRWLTWTSTFAAGTTTLVANDCEPDCADGTMFPVPRRDRPRQGQRHDSRADVQPARADLPRQPRRLRPHSARRAPALPVAVTGSASSHVQAARSARARALGRAPRLLTGQTVLAGSGLRVVAFLTHLSPLPSSGQSRPSGSQPCRSTPRKGSPCPIRTAIIQPAASCGTFYTGSSTRAHRPTTALSCRARRDQQPGSVRHTRSPSPPATRSR
jgi:hypothetical protein